MIESLLVQILGNSPTLIAVLLIYFKLDKKIFKNEMEIKAIKGRLKYVK